MANKSVEIKKAAKWLLHGMLIAAIFSISLVSFLPTTAQAQVPPPGGGGGRGCGNNCPPSAGIIFRDMDKIFSPSTGVPGELVTYTLKVVCDPYKEQINGRNVNIELTLIGNQQFVKFNSLRTNWTKRDVPGKTIWIDIGTMNPHDEGTIQIVTTVPTDLNKPIMQQGIYLNFEDDTGFQHKGFTLLLPLKVPLSTPVEQPPNPDGKSPRNLPESGPFASQSQPPVTQVNSVTSWFISATSHNLSGDFLTYWLEHGAVLVIGWPISEMFKEPDGDYVVQYFERGVMEYHPENNEPYQVLIKSLGRELNKATPSVSSDAAPSPNSVYYADTGHWLDGHFVDHWQKNGGLEQFGFPIGEPTIENGRLIQWTERARFEVDISTRFKPLVQLGLVGVELAKTKGYLPK